MNRFVKRIFPYATVCSLVIASLFGSAPLTAQVLYPTRVNETLIDNPPYNSTGVLLNDEWRGSGAVARNRRLIYTCAHVLYSAGTWLDNLEFARGWNASTAPKSLLDETVPVRGYRFYSDYSGGNSTTAFSLDFAIGYGTADTVFGPALNHLVDASADLRSESTTKLILGYPSYLRYTLELGGYYLHKTGPFKSGLTRTKGAYYTLDGVSTGPGNSGGPLIVQKSGQYYLAGILISGTSTSMGAYALNETANKMATNILAHLASGDSETVRTVDNHVSIDLPDGASSYTVRKLPVFYLPQNTTTVSFSLNVKSSYRGDLDIYVRSPAGRIRWINKHSLAQNQSNVEVSNADYSSTYAGSNPNGDWHVYLRDYFIGDKASFLDATITVTAQ